MSLIGIEVPSERVTGVDRSKQLLAATAVSKASNDAKSILVLLLFCAFVKEILFLFLRCAVPRSAEHVKIQT
tara:strand:+ start:923 stop:1138 length:216 start_codon:yes stop_codon:yes gene_type:complete